MIVSGLVCVTIFVADPSILQLKHGHKMLGFATNIGAVELMGTGQVEEQDSTTYKAK